jgi:preprotein translocase subunit SecA
MTGTAATEAEEFFNIYNLPVVSIPTNEKMIRIDSNDKIFRTNKEKNKAIVDKVIECHKKGQPILIGTTSINKSETYSKLLKINGIKHSVLNAKHHEKEANIIADAGKIDAVTVSTNMAGRGTDIKLGGKNFSENNFEEKNKVKELGGLFVIGTERHESRRIDNQLRGRSGRQGDQGDSIFYISLEDDLMRIFGSESMTNILKKLGLKENESIDHPWINKALERAQQKVEARNYDIRKTLLKFDDVMNDQRQVVFSQRKDVLKNEKIYELTNDFLNEIINSFSTEKKEIQKNLKNKNITMQLKSLLGKNIDEKNLNSLLKSNDKEFKNKIIEIFNHKRSEREKMLGNKQNIEIEKRIFIQTLDTNWRSHLQYLDQLRQVIGLRSYGQKDPLVEYRKEAFSLFENLLEKIKFDVLTILYNLTIVENTIDNQKKKEAQQKIVNNPDCLLLIHKSKKISRNEKCLVTGKKFKHCCGAL